MFTGNQTKEAIERDILLRASQDAAFRQNLLDDPKGTIADFLGAALPPGMQITVLEEQPGHHILVLPPAVPAMDLTPDALPLDDLELALVGGGRTMRPGAYACEQPHCGSNEEIGVRARSGRLRSSC